MRPAQVEQPAITHQQQDENAPYQVVNVHAMHHHPLEVSLVVHDPVNQDSHTRKCDQERDRGDEHAPPRPVGDGRAHQESQAG